MIIAYNKLIISVLWGYEFLNHGGNSSPKTTNVSMNNVLPITISPLLKNDRLKQAARAKMLPAFKTIAVFICTSNYLCRSKF
jgi:hypothetical protein